MQGQLTTTWSKYKLQFSSPGLSYLVLAWKQVETEDFLVYKKAQNQSEVNEN